MRHLFLPNVRFDPTWNTHERGLWGERAVARALWWRGYRIVAHRWRGRLKTDIDLVAVNDEMVLFAEVKLRTTTSSFDAAAEVLDPVRLAALRGAVGDYLAATAQPFVAFRVHAFFVWPDPTRPRRAVVSVLRDYLNPRSIRSWRGSVELLPVHDGLADLSAEPVGG